METREYSDKGCVVGGGRSVLAGYGGGGWESGVCGMMAVWSSESGSLRSEFGPAIVDVWLAGDRRRGWMVCAGGVG